jgi:Flp pilus assembly protein TadG
MTPTPGPIGRPRLLRDARGQSIIEFAIVMPLFLLLVLGVVEVGYALLDQHVATRLTREGANLISRNTDLQDAAQVLAGMSSRPVNFNDGSSSVIFSVLMRGATTGTVNYNKLILRQRYKYGSYPGTSKLNTAGGASFGGPPNYEAANSDNNANLQVTNPPANLVSVPGGMIYVTEIYTRHTLITPFHNFGVQVPQTLYSISYF